MVYERWWCEGAAYLAHKIHDLLPRLLRLWRLGILVVVWIVEFGDHGRYETLLGEVADVVFSWDGGEFRPVCGG